MEPAHYPNLPYRPLSSGSFSLAIASAFSLLATTISTTIKHPRIIRLSPLSPQVALVTTYVGKGGIMNEKDPSEGLV